MASEESRSSSSWSAHCCSSLSRRWSALEAGRAQGDNLSRGCHAYAAPDPALPLPSKGDFKGGSLASAIGGREEIPRAGSTKQLLRYRIGSAPRKEHLAAARDSAGA